MKYILVAEDELVYGKILEKHLLELDYHVLHVRNGAEALSCIRQSKPYLFVLDLIMPVMTGFEVLSVLKESKHIERPTKIVVVSNLESEEDISTVKNLGVDGYIGKTDTDIMDVIAQIKNLLLQ